MQRAQLVFGLVNGQRPSGILGRELVLALDFEERNAQNCKRFIVRFGTVLGNTVNGRILVWRLETSSFIFNLCINDTQNCMQK